MLGDYRELECSCDKCKGMCSNYPCWPTPDEAMELIENGYGDRLMLDQSGSIRDNVIYLLSPACEGHEMTVAPKVSALSINR